MYMRLVNRVLKWWCHKNEISEIMGFVKIFWKNNVQEAYLPKMSISGQIVSDIVAQLCLENSIQTLLNLPRNAHFRHVGLLDIVLSEYSDKSHNFGNFIFMTSHFSTLLGCALSKCFTFSISLFVDTYIFYRAGYSVFRFKKVTFKQLQNYRGMEM